MIRSLTVACLLAMIVSVAPGDDASITDLLTGVIDPFAEGPERAKFLKAAGPDTELDEQEFNADKDSKEGFVRAFDHWAMISRFDANRNQKIDWLEAHDYRRGIMTILLAKHDKNEDGRLTALEREEANRALGENRLPAYFNIACCGGPPADAASFQTASKQLADLRREHRLTEADLQQFHIKWDDEQKWLPFSETLNIKDIASALNLDENHDVCAVMPPEHRRDLETLVYHVLRSRLTGDLGSSKATIDAMLQFIYGRDAPDTPEYAKAAHQAATLGKLLRAGLATNPIELARGRGSELLPEGRRGRNRLLDQRLDRELTIVTIKVAASFHPLFVFNETPDSASSAVAYCTNSIRIAYDPRESRYPFYVAPPSQSKITSTPWDDIPKYLMSP